MVLSHNEPGIGRFSANNLKQNIALLLFSNTIYLATCPDLVLFCLVGIAFYFLLINLAIHGAYSATINRTRFAFRFSILLVYDTGKRLDKAN